MNTQDFTSSRVKAGHTFYTQYRVITDTAELTETHKASRWFKAFGHQITAVRKVSIASDIFVPGRTPPDFNSKMMPWAHYIEVETPFAIACIVDFYDCPSDVRGLILKDGRSDKTNTAKTLETWRKYGSKRGLGMSWLRAKHGLGWCKSPESGRDICCAEAYERLATGRQYGVAV